MCHILYYSAKEVIFPGTRVESQLISDSSDSTTVIRIMAKSIGRITRRILDRVRCTCIANKQGEVGMRTDR